MRFKLVNDDNEGLIKINVLIDKTSQTIIPEDTDQHLYFPIPNKLKNDVLKKINNIIDKEDSYCIKQIDKKINNLIKERKKILNEMREKYNPKIHNFCKEYKMDNSEWFI